MKFKVDDKVKLVALTTFDEGYSKEDFEELLNEEGVIIDIYPGADMPYEVELKPGNLGCAEDELELA